MGHRSKRWGRRHSGAGKNGAGKNGTTARRSDKFFDYLLSSLWFRPALWMIACSSLAVGLVVFDRWLDGWFDTDRLPWLLRSDPNDARAMLGAIVGAMLTVVSLVFSVVMLAVVQTAQAYSPQLLRQYIADTRNQHVLGILLGTFLYSLFVLRSTRTDGFAPTLATSTAVLLAVIATVALVSFLHHVPQSMKVSSIIRMILEDCEEELEREFPTGLGADCLDIPSDEQLADDSQRLLARASGYIELFDMQPLTDRERKSAVYVRMHWRMGDFILEGAPLASVWGEFDERDREAMVRACVFGNERTMRQDPRFGIKQLTDIALRSLSTGINDPSTACEAINALAVLFAKLFARESTSEWRCDITGLLHIEFQRARFDELIEASYLLILSHGAKDQQLVRGLIAACEQLETVAETAAQRETLWGVMLAVHAAASEQITTDAFRETLDADFERVCAVFEQPLLRRLSSAVQLNPSLIR